MCYDVAAGRSGGAACLRVRHPYALPVPPAPCPPRRHRHRRRFQTFTASSLGSPAIRTARCACWMWRWGQRRATARRAPSLRAWMGAAAAAAAHTAAVHALLHSAALQPLTRPALPRQQVLVAHNGPTGLGARRHSICGVDWTEPEADHGDPDLQVGSACERAAWGTGR